MLPLKKIKSALLLITFVCGFVSAQETEGESFAERCETHAKDQLLSTASKLIMDYHGQETLAIDLRGLMLHLLISNKKHTLFEREELKTLIYCEGTGENNLFGDLIKALVFEDPITPTLSPDELAMFYKLVTAVAFIRNNYPLFVNTLTILESLLKEDELIEFFSDLHWSLLYEPAAKVCQMQRQLAQDREQLIACDRSLADYNNPLTSALKSRHEWLSPVFLMLESSHTASSIKQRLLYQQAVLNNDLAAAHEHFHLFLEEQLKANEERENLQQIVKTLLWRYQLNNGKYDLALELDILPHHFKQPELNKKFGSVLKRAFSHVDPKFPRKVKAALLSTQ